MTDGDGNVIVSAEIPSEIIDATRLIFSILQLAKKDSGLFSA